MNKDQLEKLTQRELEDQVYTEFLKNLDRCRRPMRRTVDAWWISVLRNRRYEET